MAEASFPANAGTDPVSEGPPAPPTKTGSPTVAVPAAKARGSDVPTVAPPGKSSPPSPVEGATPVAQRLGDYELVAEIARGGMGVIYRAHQHSLQRTVAVKLILAGQLASPDDIRRFHIEAQAAAQLDHPSIVPIFEVGDCAGQHFFSMKLLDGGSLAQHMARYQGDPRAALDLMIDVTEAVQYAHERGILHRDLKPANILLDAHGHPYISDFGLAKRLAAAAGEASAPLTQSGAVLGTPGYLAPEQARGEKELTAAADIFSLGAILYELISGRPAFRAETLMEALLQVQHHEPPTPRSVNPAAPAELATICMKALAKAPADRYPSAAALVLDLERYRNRQPIQARPIRRLGRGWRWCRRNPVLAGLSLLVGVLLLAVLVLAAILAPRPGDGSLARVQRAGQLVVAADPTYPPMEFYQDGQIAGFDVDMAHDLAHRLGVTVKLVPVAWVWHDIVRRLDAHDCDVLISTVTQTPDRSQQVDFVEYLRLSTVFVGKKGLAVKRESDLAGKVLAVQLDTRAHQWVKEVEARKVAIKNELNRSAVVFQLTSLPDPACVLFLGGV